MERLGKDFFERSCLEVAPELCGKLLFHRLQSGEVLSLRITETEAYNGECDSACHAYRGKTPRSAMLWREAGTVYVYLCYGIHNLINVITGREEEPEGVLIRAGVDYNGPGKLTKYLKINREHNGLSFIDSEILWIADDGERPEIITDKRIGIEYAKPEDKERLWRFIANYNSSK